MLYNFVARFMVKWSSGYDLCLTSCELTEGPQFDPGLDHFCLAYLLQRDGSHINILKA